MKLQNYGSQMHCPQGMIAKGTSEVKDDAWAKMKELPMVKKALAAKRLVELPKGKEAPKKEDPKPVADKNAGFGKGKKK